MTPRRFTYRVGTVLVAAALLAALVGPLLTPHDPAAQTLSRRLERPTFDHPFGLDELGRDVLSRILSGARVSLLVGVSVVSVSSVAGLLLGLLAGYLGGRIDQGISRVMDILMAFPGILLAIALVAVRGPSLVNVVFALSVIGWVSYARLTRSQVLKLRELEFVQAARGLAGAIIAEASLSFLGLGVQPPTPSWGAMLDAGRAHLLDAPHLTLFPGLSIALLVIGFNLLGDGLRDRLDPRG